MFVGGVFAALITWVAPYEAFAEGGFALLAGAVFGLATGLCIGGLIAANFAMLAVEGHEKHELSLTARPRHSQRLNRVIVLYTGRHAEVVSAAG